MRNPTWVETGLAMAGTALLAVGAARTFWNDAKVSGASQGAVDYRLYMVEKQMDIFARRQEWTIILLRRLAEQSGVQADPLPMSDQHPSQKHVQGMIDAYAGTPPGGQE